LYFHEFLHTMYKYTLNYVVKISVMSAEYFEYYSIIPRGRFFVHTLYLFISPKASHKHKPGIELVQTLADISRSSYVVIATKPVHHCYHLW